MGNLSCRFSQEGRFGHPLVFNSDLLQEVRPKITMHDKNVNQGEILRCPWHGWEFDITNGKPIFDPHKCLVKTYEVAVEEVEDENSSSVETYSVEVEANHCCLYMTGV